MTCSLHAALVPPATDHPPTVTVVIPCYNERATILTLINRVLAADFSKEVIVVDDGSTDGTQRLLSEEAALLPGVRIFLQPANRGKGAALHRGFREAAGHVVIVQDADLEYDPAEIPNVIAPILAGEADVVFGSRFLGGRPHRVLYFWHSVGNSVLTLLSNMVTDLNLTDMETCYKAFRREVIQGLTLHEERFGFEPEVTIKLSRQNLRIYEVPISYRGRRYAEGKKIGVKDGFRALYCLAKYAITDRTSGTPTAE